MIAASDPLLSPLDNMSPEDRATVRASMIELILGEHLHAIRLSTLAPRPISLGTAPKLGFARWNETQQAEQETSGLLSPERFEDDCCLP